MKKILILLVIAFALIAAAAAFFLMTFNADSLRPVFQERVSEAIGNPVKIGKIGLAWEKGFALEIDALEIFEGSGSAGGPVMVLDRATALVKWAPLLRRDLQIGEVILESPKLTLVKEASGMMRIRGISPPAGASASGDHQAGAALPFFISVLKIENGELRFRDEQDLIVTEASSRPQPREVAIRNVDVTLKNLSFVRPVAFEAGLSLFSPRQNILFQGRFRIPLGSSQGAIEDFVLTTDLADLDMEMLRRSMPDLRQAGLRSLSRGNVNFRVDRFELSERGLASLDAELDIRGVALEWENLKSPVENLNLKARLAEGRIVLEEAGAQLADGTVSASGFADGLSAEPRYSLDIKVEKLALGALLPNQPAGEPQLQGRLGLDARFTALGLTGPRIEQTLSGSGRMTLRDGAILNLNLLREVLGKLSVLPGLMNRLKERLPEDYRERLNARDTKLEPVDQPFQITGNQLLLNPIKLATENFQLTGSGGVSRNGALSFQNWILIDPQLSQAMITSVRELEYLLDGAGWMAIPIRIQGTTDKPSILPDLAYVAQKLAVRKTQELISNVLQPRRQPAPQEGTGTSAPASSGSNLPAASSRPEAPSAAPAGQPLLTETLGRLLGGYGDNSSGTAANEAPASSAPAQKTPAEAASSAGGQQEVTPQGLLFNLVQNVLEAKSSSETTS